jgi:hypothetical protein
MKPERLLTVMSLLALVPGSASAALMPVLHLSGIGGGGTVAASDDRSSPWGR